MPVRVLDGEMVHVRKGCRLRGMGDLCQKTMHRRQAAASSQSLKWLGEDQLSVNDMHAGSPHIPLLFRFPQVGVSVNGRRSQSKVRE